MQKFSKSLLWIMPVLLILSGCMSSSVSTSLSCTGYSMVESSRYKKHYSKKRTYQVKGETKPYKSKKSRF